MPYLVIHLIEPIYLLKTESKKKKSKTKQKQQQNKTIYHKDAG